MKTIHFATPLTVTDRKRQYPVSKQDKALIQSSFKPEYFHQVYIWFLLQGLSKRTKVISFIKGEAAPISKYPVIPPLSARCPKVSQSVELNKPELVLRSPRATINFNRALINCSLEHPTAYNLNSKRSSPTCIDKDGIFGGIPYETRGVTARGVSDDNSIAIHLIHQLFNFGTSKLLEPLANDAYPLLKEISTMLELKDNIYPIDRVRSNPGLGPVFMSDTIKRTAELDHIRNPTSPRNELSPRNRDISSSNYADFLKSPRVSASQDALNESLDEKYHISMTKLYRPSVSPLPFGLFPKTEAEPVPRSPFMKKQVRMNQKSGRLNFNVFNGPTVL